MSSSDSSSYYEKASTSRKRSRKTKRQRKSNTKKSKKNERNSHQETVGNDVKVLKTQPEECVASERNDDESAASKKEESGETPVITENASASSEEASSVATPSKSEPSSSQSETTSSKSEPDDASTSTQSTSTTKEKAEEKSSAKDRFNTKNHEVTPLRKCSELIPGRRYQIILLARTNTQYGPAVRATILDDKSPTGRSFLYLPVRFRSMSDEDLAELNLQCTSESQLHIVYNGRVGRADMVELV